MIFRLEYKNKELDVARLDITTPGTIVNEVEGTENPFVLQYKSDKSDKSGHFLTSSAEINIYETPEFNIDVLKTSNETEIKVDYYINSEKKWTGFVLPDFFSKEIGNKSVVSMVASDRIGTLKGVTLTDLNAFVSLRTLAEECLAKTGLNLPLKTMVDLEAGAVNFFNIEALSQRLVDNKGRSISCYDVLSSILVASNSTVLQRNAEWYIVNKLQHELGQGKLYSDNTAFTNWVDIIHNFSEVTVGARRSIVPVAASTGVYHEHGGGRLHPDNYDFSKGLAGWTPVGGFSASINNQRFDGFTTGGTGGAGYFPNYIDGTQDNYLVTNNQYIRNINPVYIESDAIDVPYKGSGSIEIELDVNATGPGTYFSFSGAFIRASIVAVSPTKTLTLAHGGKFIDMPSENPPVFEKEFDRSNPENNIYKAISKGMKVKGTLEVTDDLSVYKIKIRLYGGGGGRTVLFNSVSLTMRSSLEAPKGTIFKSEQGSNFTKEHEIETTIWGDHITSGLNGYFYDYPVDDTSSLYSGGVLTSKWTDLADPLVERSLLHHIAIQKSRMFSVAHDILSAELDVRLFDPLSVYESCSKRYVLVSATVDFLRGLANVNIEESAYQSLSKRDFIYSYFGDKDSGIKSIGGISSGSSGGSSGGLTPEQANMLADVNALSHLHENKAVLDQIKELQTELSTTAPTDENIMSSLRVLKEILDNNEYLGTQFLSKVNPDTAAGRITFLEGLISKEAAGLEKGFVTLSGHGVYEYGDAVFGNTALNGVSVAERADLQKGFKTGGWGLDETGQFGARKVIGSEAVFGDVTLQAAMRSPVFHPGMFGEGFFLGRTESGRTYIECDDAYFRGTMTIEELIIHNISHTGGAFLFSPAGGDVAGVQNMGSYWRLELKDKDNIFFKQYDQVLCQNFSENKKKRYWRLCTSVDYDNGFIHLSKTDCEALSANPETGDEIITFGSRNDPKRQNAIYISSYGEFGPYQQFLRGVDSYDLTGKIDIELGKETLFTVDRLEIRGKDGKKKRVPRERGAWTDGETYYYYDRVRHDGAFWLCMVLQTTIRPSEKAPEWVKETNVKVGGANLLREYAVQFGFKYWGGLTAQEGVNWINVDMDAIMAGAKYLRVAPSAIAWVFPEYEADINVQSNVDWTVS